MHKELKSEKPHQIGRALSWKASVWKCCLSDQSPNTMRELLSSNTNHPSTLAFQNHSHVFLPRNEWWLPCVMKYSTSQQCFTKKVVHEFFKLFCKSLCKLTMKANTSAGMQVPSYPHIHPDTGICGSHSPLMHQKPSSLPDESIAPTHSAKGIPHSESCSGTQGQFCHEERIWGLSDRMCLLWNWAVESRGSKAHELLPGRFPKQETGSLKCICFAVPMTASLLGRQQVGDLVFVCEHYQKL